MEINKNLKTIWISLGFSKFMQFDNMFVISTSSITVLKRKTCAYLSPDFPLRAARTGQRPLGRLKQLREKNWECFTRALFTFNTVMLDVVSPCKVQKTVF